MTEHYIHTIQEHKELEVWLNYIKDWTPDEPGDLPAPPPKADGWKEFWKVIQRPYKERELSV